MFRISKSDEQFFEMFVKSSEIVIKSAEALYEMMSNYSEIEKKILALKNIEHECDLHVHEILKTLNQSFITPIDREDIFLMAKEIDNIVDSIEATAHRFKMLNVQSIRYEALAIANLLVQCTKELYKIFYDLRNLKTSKNIREMIIEVNRIENEADELYRTAVEKLFVNEKDPIEVIKWKEIFDYLENSVDACEDVANIVEGVVMKHA